MIKYRFFSFLMLVLLPVLIWGQSGALQSVTIGKQMWMTRNLDVSIFRNGDPIPEAKTEGDWKAYNQAGEPAWCYYNNDHANGVKYGKLYNWHAVSDPRGLAPKGWHIPSDQEWTVLTDYLGGTGKAGSEMKSKEGCPFVASGINLFDYWGGDWDAAPTKILNFVSGFIGLMSSG